MALTLTNDQNIYINSANENSILYLYAAADHPNGKGLGTIRRDVGYDRPNFRGIQWEGWGRPNHVPLKSDEGPEKVSQARERVMMGACLWVAIYNIPIVSTDLSAARQIVQKVSAWGEDLLIVQTLGLFHGEESAEIDCTCWSQTKLELIVSRTMLRHWQGLDLEKGYFTEFSPWESYCGPKEELPELVAWL